jgi:prevent-host-death family protein
MITVGIRELKQQTSELIRRVREAGDEIYVTHRGKVVARIIPVAPATGQEGRQWEDLEQLALEIGERWPADISAAEAVGEARR